MEENVGVLSEPTLEVTGLLDKSKNLDRFYSSTARSEILAYETVQLPFERYRNLEHEEENCEDWLVQ